MRLAVDAAAIAEQAFVLGYPLVLTDRTMAQATAVAQRDPGAMRAPVNELVVGRDTPDTLRIAAWLDVAAQPLVLSVPDTRGRFCMLWLRDAYNAVFATVGAQATDTAPQALGVLGPASHHVRLPDWLAPVPSPTRVVHLTGCVEAVGEPEEELLAWAGEAFALTPLGGSAAPPAPAGDTASALSPVEQVERMDAPTYFSELLRLVDDNPPEPAGRTLLEQLRELIAAPELRPDLERGLRRGRRAVAAAAAQLPRETVARWRIGIGNAGGDRVRRASTARAGLGADPATEALTARLDCDAAGRPLTGRSRYELCFAPEGIPPVHGFWSLTAHGPDASYSIGDRHGLALDLDGSLPIYLQSRPPARPRRSNWLPVPAGPFTIVLKLYWPAERALRLWTPPALTRTA